MITDHKQHYLFGKTLLQKVTVRPPFEFNFPIADNACFLYMLEGGIQYHREDELLTIPGKHSLFLNCLHSGKQISNPNPLVTNEIVIINFHPDTLKKVYDKELPALLQPPKNPTSNKSLEKINNEFLIQKYVEGLLFYFENPSLINEEILVLKLKEIILLLSQTRNAESIQLILSQLFSPAIYTFKQVIEAHLFSPYTIEELADQTNLSLSSFKREFTKVYNDTPANYIKTKRLEKAAQLLVVSDKRITDIAYECGFNDLANFTKSFHDKFNTTPTNYRLSQSS